MTHITTVPKFSAYYRSNPSKDSQNQALDSAYGVAPRGEFSAETKGEAQALRALEDRGLVRETTGSILAGWFGHGGSPMYKLTREGRALARERNANKH